MKIADIRRARLRQLIAEKFHGNQTAFGEKIDRSQNYVSRLISGKSPASGGKNLGERLAREFEEKLGIEPGWFDRPGTNKISEPRASSYVIASDDYPALIANRIREADEAVQLAVLNMIEAFLADGRENSQRRKRRKALLRAG